MAFKHKTVVFGDFMLTLFDFVVGEFDDCAAIGANKVVVVIAVVKFKDRLASIKLAAHQNAGLLELGEHSVNCSQAYVDILGNKCTVDVFGTLMAKIGPSKNIKDFQAREETD